MNSLGTLSNSFNLLILSLCSRARGDLSWIRILPHRFVKPIGDLPLVAAAVGLPLAFTVLNIFGAKESTSITTLMVAIKVFALTLLLISGYYLLVRAFALARNF